MRLLKLIISIAVLLLSAVNASAQDDGQEVQCQFSVIENAYTCYLEMVNVTSASVPLHITGEHLEGMSHANVASIRTAQLGFTPIIHLIHPEFFTAFPSLQQLVIRNAQLSTLNLENCENITRIVSNENPLTELKANVFAACTKLQSLALWFNDIALVHADAFAGLARLEVLDLWGNARIDLVNGSLTDATSLREFYFVGGSGSLEAGVLFPAAATLEILELRRLRLDSVALISDLTALVSLDLSENMIASLENSWFAQLSRLERINLSDNELTAVPSRVFSSLAALTELSLEHNKISLLEMDSFAGLTALHTLSLADNVLRSLEMLPFAHLTQLTSLSLAHNPLFTLPPSLFSANVRLTLLNVVDCQLATLSAQLPDALISLHADHNLLAVFLPHTNLEMLTLTHNRFAELAPAEPLPALRMLLLNANSLYAVHARLLTFLTPRLRVLGATENKCLAHSLYEDDEEGNLSGESDDALAICYRNWADTYEPTTTASTTTTGSETTSTPSGAMRLTYAPVLAVTIGLAWRLRW